MRRSFGGSKQNNDRVGSNSSQTTHKQGNYVMWRITRFRDTPKYPDAKRPNEICVVLSPDALPNKATVAVLKIDQRLWFYVKYSPSSPSRQSQSHRGVCWSSVAVWLGLQARTRRYDRIQAGRGGRLVIAAASRCRCRLNPHFPDILVTLRGGT